MMIAISLISNDKYTARIQHGDSIYRVHTGWLELRSGEYFIDHKHLTFWRKER